LTLERGYHQLRVALPVAKRRMLLLTPVMTFDRILVS